MGKPRCVARRRQPLCKRLEHRARLFNWPGTADLRQYDAVPLNICTLYLMQPRVGLYDARPRPIIHRRYGECLAIKPRLNNNGVGKTLKIVIDWMWAKGQLQAF